MLQTYANMLPTCPYATCWLDIVSTLAATVFGHVADMSADMSATCRADTHVSVDSTIFSTFKNPTFPAKKTMNYTIKSHQRLKTRIQIGGTTPRYNPTILIMSPHSQILRLIDGNNHPYTDVQCPKTQQVFSSLRFSTSFTSDSFIHGGK
jgi:hypothetical protein